MTSNDENPILTEIDNDPAMRRAYEKERAIVDVTEMIYHLMEEKKITKTQLAEKMGVAAANITQLLSGKRNMTIATVSNVLNHLGFAFELGWRHLKRLAVTDLEPVSWAGADSEVWTQGTPDLMWSSVKKSSSAARQSETPIDLAQAA